MPTASWAADARPEAGADVRLFCLPYAGGGASVFRGWARQLPASIDVRPVQLPGREERWTEPPCDRLEPLVPALRDGLASALDRPYALFGHSMGALVAFELARELRRSRLPPPRALFVSAHRAPHLPSPRPRLHHLADAPFLDEVRRLHEAPAELLDDPDLRAHALTVLRADFALCERYDHVADAPLDCPIVAFGGAHDTHVSRLELDAWREHTRAEFQIVWLPGGHLFLHTARSMLLRHLAARLATAPLDDTPVDAARTRRQR